MNIASVMQTLSVAAIPLLFAITIHEVAHGYVANKLGDRTALMLGRITLNPIKHIDPLGTIIVPLITLVLGGVIFGWAKPVPVTWQNLRDPRRDMAIVALAGPATNFLMALGWALIIKIMILIHLNVFSLNNNVLEFLYLMCSIGVWINCIFMILNLIPIPPLDGSRVVSSLLPRHLAYHYDKLEPYGIFIIIGLLVTGLFAYFILPATFIVHHWVEQLFQVKLAFSRH